MTRRVQDWRAMRPGDVVRSIKSGALRVVVYVGRKCVCLIKIGKSWTDPNPGAWYDCWAFNDLFTVTGKRAPGALRHYPMFFVAKNGRLTSTGKVRVRP